MAAGGNEPGEMVCDGCSKSWFSTIFLQEGEHACPACGALLAPVAQRDPDDAN